MRWLLCVTLLALCASPAAAQRPNFEQQMRDNQRRLEDIRRERSAVEQELERLRTQAHSISDEISNLERQRDATNRIVNELDRQIGGLGTQIDQMTVDLTLAEDALAEKRAVLERRIVDISKRGPLYAYQVLLAAESFGDLLSRYKYLYLVSRQDRLLTNDMTKLKNRVARERAGLVGARDALGRRKTERAGELRRYVDLARQREGNLRATKRSLREAERRLSEKEREEKRLNDVIAALERARREAEARGATATAATITENSLGRLDWPIDGRVVYQFGPAPGPNNTRITWHGIGIAAPEGTPVKAVAAGTVALVGPLGTYLTTVIIDHGRGYYTVYATLKDAVVTKGERVLRGQIVGRVGGANSAQGAHLHFEIRGQDQIALDPLNWLRRR
jgi:septal ring factor EnvC (AmiA/AmiB activator)